MSSSINLLFRQLGIGIRVLIAMTVICGIVYPLAILGIGQLVANDQANGSLITKDNQVVGSSLIGQDFSGQEQYFWGRPSASDYDSLASGGSNLAADSPDLVQAVNERRAELAAANGVTPESIPADALTASGSGLDPEISPEYATLQVNRVARARGLPAASVSDLLAEHVESPLLGFIGQDRVNVLELNLALDGLK